MTIENYAKKNGFDVVGDPFEWSGNIVYPVSKSEWDGLHIGKPCYAIFRNGMFRQATHNEPIELLHAEMALRNHGQL